MNPKAMQASSQLGIWLIPAFRLACHSPVPISQLEKKYEPSVRASK